MKLQILEIGIAGILANGYFSPGIARRLPFFAPTSMPHHSARGDSQGLRKRIPMSIRAKLLIAGGALSAVTFYLAYLGASSSWQYYLTIDECVKHSSEFAGRSVRVSGHVARGSLSFDDNRGQATFILKGANGRLQTVCLGPLPDNLTEEMDVVVEGRLEGTNLLRGKKVLTRCASKYASNEGSK